MTYPIPNGYADYNFGFLGDFREGISDSNMLAGIIGLNVKAYGATGNNTNDAVAFDLLFDDINRLGSVTLDQPISVTVPAGVYDLRAAGVRKLLVSNVTFNIDPDAILIFRDGPFFTAGDDLLPTIQNIWVYGGQPRINSSDTVIGTNTAFIYGVNMARLFMVGQRFVNCPYFRGVSSTTLSGIFISRFSGSSHITKDAVHIDTSANVNSVAASLFLTNDFAYGYVPPTNPAFSPKAITGATQANPVVVTCPSHGYATGDRIRHGGVTGMTELNGLDATITALTANTYSLNGVDGTGFGAFVAAGTPWAVELLWTWQYDTAIVSIKGHWDTAVIQGGLYQHYPWLWKLEQTGAGTITYIYEQEVIWDFAGSGHIWATINSTGAISHVEIHGGWNFTCNDDWLKVTRPGAGFITDLKVTNHTIGMTGGSFINDKDTDAIINLEVNNVRVVGMGRARVGLCYLFRPGNTGNNTSTIRDVRMENPGGYYPNGATYLRPDIGIQLTQDLRWTVLNNELDCLTTHYDIPTVGTTGSRQRLVRNNKCRSGALPEYITTTSPAAPASGVLQTNHTGFNQRITLYGGAMTAVAQNGVTVMTGGGPFTLTVSPGETWSVTHGGAPTMTITHLD